MNPDEARVSMQWPKELKERVRERAGARGLTEFVIEAVLDRLGTEPTAQKPVVSVPEMPEIVTPDTQECPQHHKTFFIVGAECPKCRQERRAQEAETEEGPAPVAPVVPEDEHVARLVGDDHLAQVLEMARNKGIEMPSIDLKPASQIPKPGITIEDSDGVREIEYEMDPVAAREAGIATHCADCHEELVDGECWTCG